MTVFIYDTDSGANARRWDKLVGRHQALVWRNGRLNTEEKVVFTSDVARGQLVVCHGLGEDREVEKTLENLATEGAYVIDVVGNDRSMVSPIAVTIYRRKKGVAKPTDEHFKTCFAFFQHHLESSGVPKWELLEGPPVPDALFAYHLLKLLLSDDPEAQGTCRALREAATAEAEAISGATGIPRLNDIEDAKQRREFLRACC